MNQQGVTRFRMASLYLHFRGSSGLHDVPGGIGINA